MEDPKILILNQPFDSRTGGGITLSNLFDNWPKSKLRVACPSQLILSYTDFSKCEEYYQIGEEEQKWIFPFNVIRKKTTSGIIKGEIEISPTLDGFKQTAISKVKKFLTDKMFFPIIHFSGLVNFISKTIVSEKFLNWINEFSPDLIYAQAQSLQEVIFCRKIQEATGIPMVFHMMDDWITLSSQSNISQFFWRSKVEFEFRRMLERCSSLMTISDYMAASYYERFGMNSSPFHNPVDLNFWGNNQQESKLDKDTPTILYAGRVGLGIDESLISMADAVLSLNLELNCKIKFIIQSETQPNWITKYDCVAHKGFGPYADLPETFSKADLLYLPYDFTESSIKFIKYSMPTKASEYMISGTPIFILAPKETAIIEYAEREKWAITVTKNESGIIKKNLKEILFNSNLRDKVTQQAMKICLLKHEKNIVQKKFYEQLILNTKSF